MQVIIDQQRLTLDKGDVLNNQGGEALIYRLGQDEAVKIYYQADMARQRKLKDFWHKQFGLPGNVLSPERPVQDQRNRLIGFTMRRLADEYEPIVQLSLKDFCQEHQLSAKDLVQIFLSISQDIALFHQLGLLVGDLNDKNEFIHPDKRDIVWLDVDSWQFDQHPCMVGKEDYLSPDLYGVDLSKQPMFRPEHDWYSFTVLLTMALLRAHPFKGFHPKWKSLMACAEHGATVFDAGVRYPKVALPPEVLTDDLRELITSYLKRQRHDAFPIEELVEYRELLVGCNFCGVWYPAKLSQCPGCASKTMLDARLAAKVAGYECETLLSTSGRIIHTQIVGATVLCLTEEIGQVVLYEKAMGQTLTRKELFSATPGARYDIFDRSVVVCPQPAANKPKLYILDWSQTRVRPLAQTVTDQLAGSRAVFACSRRYLYRLAGGRILQGEPFGSHDLAEREVAQALPNQTWFTVAPNPEDEHELLFGFFRVFGETNWFLVVSDESTKRFQRFDIDLPKLEAGESLVDMSIRFSTATLLVMRKTHQGGLNFVRVTIVSTQDGQVKESYRAKVSDEAVWDSIHGKAYTAGVILHARDEGIYKEVVQNQDRLLLPNTSQYVKNDDLLYPYAGSLLIATGEHLLKLKRV